MAAVTATIGALGIGVVYLPFIADRDQMRGLHEEQSPPTSAMLAQEIKKLQQEGLLRGDDQEADGSKPDRKGWHLEVCGANFREDSVDEARLSV